ncbi:hypothetical protein GPA22_07215 [Aromatoleum toluvorans]|uniref:Tfp pilus assembly protein FimV n=1 Tax=Aromatoleum toluvorans TaxID=92002 RepID=A0ABX1PZJ6_9RHOO|nr:hypothetical protein [Aromatoleum toluvorans]NMG43521.1 hypothetical protein [Aromatoleum toluvorans]
MTTQQRLTPGDSASLLLTALLALAPTTSGAVVLGEPVSVSKIGEPLRIEISILQGSASRLGECLRLTAASTPNGVPRLRNARLDVAGRDPESRLVLSHRLPSFEPAVSFAIEDNCDSRLRREYTVLLAFPDTTAVAGETANDGATSRPDTVSESAVAQEPPRRPRDYRRTTPPADTTAAPSTAREAATPSSRSAPKGSPRQDRLELGGGESGTPGAGLRLSIQLGSLARIDSTTDAQREQLRREQSVIMAIDRTIVAQLELNERIRQLEAVQSRMFAEYKQSQPSAATSSADPVIVDAPPPPKPLEPDHSVAEGWKRGTLTIGFVSLALAGALAWIRKRRQGSLPRSEPESKRTSLPVAKKAAAPPPTRRIEPAPDTTTEADFARQPQILPTPANVIATHASPEWEMADDIFAQPISIAPIAPIAAVIPAASVAAHTPAAPAAIEETAEEHESAIELAEIMMGFGRIRGAADTLAEFIASNPKRAVTPWLKLMEVYRTADLREEFDALAMQLNKTFNVKAVTWDSFDEARQARNSIEQMEHLARNVQETWGTRDCQAYLEHLLRDNRDGTREGFPLSVIDEILLLAAILEDQLGTYRPQAETPSPASGDSAVAVPPQPA